MFSPKHLLGMLLFGIIIYSGWLFWWVLIECTYAMSFDPFFENELKLPLFIIGGIIFWASAYTTAKLMI